MDISELKKIIRLFEESKIFELELEKDGNRVRLKKGSEGLHIPAHTVPAAVAFNQPGASVDQAGAPQAAPAPVNPNHIVVSPMVGTFYKSSSPTNAPFVNEGDIIRKGQVLCIVEAMKLMNEIEADEGGRVVKIFPENGKPVEYNEPLFEIAPL
ncbi:MAG: acetyl-CoA carboxylase biotin carboxyl carrier protein [Nitrospinae bacterium]|nr:acetyl-CoA carboxylase biotin carboxyl carrier protein [Nitrospinota bacterium]